MDAFEEISSASSNNVTEDEVEALKRNPNVQPIVKLTSWGIHAMNVVGCSLQDILGSGTNSVVRKGIRRADNAEFAIKCVISQNKELRQRVRDEYHFMRSLSHGNIITTEVLYESRFDMWLFMELCDDTLQTHGARHGGFTEARSRILSLQMLRGVSYLHRKRIIHGDLSPNHLLLQKKTTKLKIGGFNNAQKIGSGEVSIFVANDSGTRRCSAPEHFFSRLVNERMDIWGMGFCAYFMMHAQLPFNMSDVDVMKSLMLGRLPDTRWGDMSDRARNFVEDCLEVSVHNRPTALELFTHSWIRRSSPARHISEGVEDSFPCGLKSHHETTLFMPVSGLLFVHHAHGITCAPLFLATEEGDHRTEARQQFVPRSYVRTLEELPALPHTNRSASSGKVAQMPISTEVGD